MAWSDLNVRAAPLDLGDVALPRSCMEGKTRVSSQTTDLDPGTFRSAQTKVSVEDLISLFTTVTNCEYASENIEAGRILGEVEGQLIEFEFPWETDPSFQSSDNWFTKSAGLYLPPLLNGAAHGEEVQLWLGVQDKTGLMIGAGVDGHRLPRNIVENMRIFPGIRTVKIKEFKIMPPTGDLFVKWIADCIELSGSDHKTKQIIKQAWEMIVSLNGRGWLVHSDTKRFGVVATEQRVGYEPFHGGGDFITQRSVIRITVKSEFPHAYMSQYIHFGQYLAMYSFEAWLRLHSAHKSAFYERFNRDTSFSIRLLRGSRSSSNQDFPCTWTAYEHDDIEEIVDELFNHSAKERFVLADIDCVDYLNRLIEADLQEALSTLSKRTIQWHVGLVAPSIEVGKSSKTSLLQQSFVDAVRLLQREGVRVEEFALEMDQSLHRLVSRKSPNAAFQDLDLNPCLEIVHKDLVSPNELTKEEVKQLAKHWICPSEEGRDYGKPPWSIIKAGYLVETEYVMDIVTSIKLNLNEQSSRIIRVGSETTGCGLTGALHLAAWHCATQSEFNEYTVVFMRQIPARPAPSFDALLAHGPAIVFCDTNVELNEIPIIIRRDPKILFVAGMSAESYKEGEGWNVVVRSLWPKQHLDSLRDSLVEFDFEAHSAKETKNALATTLTEMLEDNSNTGPFFVLPWVASRGQSFHMKRSIEEQLATAKDWFLESAVNLVALFTLVLNKDRLSTFGCSPSLVGKDLPLLVVESRRQRKIARFFHSEVARAYIHHQYSSPNVDFDKFFPDRFEDLWLNDVAKYLVSNFGGRSEMNHIITELLYGRLGSARFTRLCQNLFSRPFNKPIMDSMEDLSTKAGVAPCDRDIWLSRMYREWGRVEEGIWFAQRAIENPRGNELKAQNNLAQSLADAAVIKSGPGRRMYHDQAMEIFRTLETKADTREKLDNLRIQVANFQNAYKSNTGRSTANSRSRKKSNKN